MANATPEVKFDKADEELFVAVYPTTPNSGYYQIMCRPESATPLNPAPRKMLFMLEHKGNHSHATPGMVLDEVERMLMDDLTDIDSFSIIAWQNQYLQFDTLWLAADSNNIAQTISWLRSNWQGAPTVDTHSFLYAGNSYLQRTQSTASVVLFTNNKFSSVQASNVNLLNLSGYLGNATQVHIVSYADNFNGQVYWGDPIFDRLASQTGGTYIRLFDSFLVLTGATVTNPAKGYSLPDMAQTLSNSFVQNFLAGSVDVTCVNGFIANDISSHHWGNSFGQTTYFQVGQYYGNMPLQVNFNATLGGQVVQRQWIVNAPYNADSLTPKIWADHYIHSIDRGAGNSAAVRDEIIDTSKNFRVLTNYTAFLCLEPNDTIFVCEACEDGSLVDTSSWWLGLADETAEGSIALQAIPNPFQNAIAITLDVSALPAGEVVTVQVVNLLGETVKTFAITRQPGQDKVNLNWDGQTDSGQLLASGVYVVAMHTSVGSQSLKIVKQ